jgi:cytochrome c oxidase subunit IV
MTGDGPNARRLWRGPALAWIALLVLFAISLGSAYIPLGVGNITFNLFIAVVMAIVLAVFLMDLRNAQTLIRVVAVAGLFWTVLMFTLTFSDYLSRN